MPGEELTDAEKDSLNYKKQGGLKMSKKDSGGNVVHENENKRIQGEGAIALEKCEPDCGCCAGDGKWHKNPKGANK